MATAIQVQQPVVVQEVPQLPPQNICCIKCLAITQLVIGFLTFIFGIALLAALEANTWSRNTGGGIWSGLVIGFTGILGILSAIKHNSGGLRGAYLAFSIISTLISVLAGLFFLVGIVWYSVWSFCYTWTDTGSLYGGRFVRSKCDYAGTGVGLNVVLLLLMILEFFISIIASCMACAKGCCGNNQTVVVAPYPQVAMVTTTNAQYQGNTQQQPPQYQGNTQPQPPPGQYNQPQGQPQPYTQDKPQSYPAGGY